jgi:hypothetical protein
MSSSVAPLFPKTSIFIPAFWEASRGGLLTQEEADALYLKFPVGQGTESIPNLIVSGSSTFGSVSASTLSQSGTYTNTNSGTPAKQVIINNTTPSITITDGTNTTTITPTSVGASNTLQQVLDAGNSATGATTSITLTNSASGGQANPIFTLNNTNATGSVAMEVYKNKPTAGTAGDVLFNQSVYGKDSALNKQEYTRISHTLRDSASGVEDGSIEMGCFVNGAFANFLQINGNENEVNCLKVLDMGGNNIRTTTGNITLDGTSAPNGSGDINLNPRSTAVCNVNGNFRIPSTSNNIVIGTAGSGYAGLMSNQGTNFIDNAGGRSAFTSSYGGLELTDTTNNLFSSHTQSALNFGTSSSAITTIYSSAGFTNSDNSIQCNSNNGFIMNYGSSTNKTTLDLTKLEMVNSGANNTDTILLQNIGSANPVLNIQSTEISSNNSNSMGASTSGIGLTNITFSTGATKQIQMNNANGSSSSIFHQDGIDALPFVIQTTEDLQMIIGSGKNLIMTNLPTSNPSVAGALWNNGGVLNIS